MNLEQHYIDDLFTYKKFTKTNKKVIVGIDEAGRGPVLGHLVYGALISEFPVDYPDSKKTTPASRGTLFKEIEDNHSFIYTSIHPRYISQKMLAPPRERVNLNKISYNVVINLIKEIEKEYEIDTVYVDTLGPERTYKNLLEQHFGKYKFIVEQKADLKYGIVGGASIVAKFVRDKLLDGWDLEDKEVGSGYPGDDITVQWLKRNLKRDCECHEIVRKSWKTVEKYIEVKRIVQRKKGFTKLNFKKK